MTEKVNHLDLTIEELVGEASDDQGIASAGCSCCCCCCCSCAAAEQ